MLRIEVADGVAWATIDDPPSTLLRQEIGSGSLVAILVAGASIAVGALTAAVLVRRLLTPVAAT